MKDFTIIGRNYLKLRREVMCITVLESGERKEISLGDVCPNLDQYPVIEDPGAARVVEYMNRSQRIPVLDVLLRKDQIKANIEEIDALEQKFYEDQEKKWQEMEPIGKVLQEVQNEIKATANEGKAFKVLQTVLLITYLAGSILFGAKLVLAGSLALGVSLLAVGLASYLFGASYLSKKPAQEMLRIENYLTKAQLNESTGLPLPRSLFKYLGVLPLLEALSKEKRLKIVNNRILSEIKKELEEINNWEKDLERKTTLIVENIQKIFNDRDLGEGIKKLEDVLRIMSFEIEGLEESKEFFSSVLKGEKEIAGLINELREKFSLVGMKAKELGLSFPCFRSQIDRDAVRFFDDLAEQILSDYQSAYEFIEKLNSYMEESDSSEASDSEASSDEEYFRETEMV